MEGIGRTNPVGQLGEPTLLPVGRSTRCPDRATQGGYAVHHLHSYVAANHCWFLWCM